ncbi:hypothetical protein, variant [Puccinia triticina 1-1 BBBD Race 1]|uniref:Uncharacterized protein n=1 Tax=Puccinia triticina (isolate 1-1 / race 1 (BBBD)) TaxID=630390 RepID=A0A180G5P4_PUCT1|nr:hypothetical protein PTTG_04618 [Puccinia triticina 1-1 BBBD Race 1]OAV88006.1 hypothetical protein, variant [Puccinia triticina 1-1 BBBD Race 1]
MIADDSALGQPDSVKLCALIGRWFNDFATRPIEVLPFRNILPLTGFTIVHSLRIAYLYHSVLSSQGVKVGRSKQDVSFLQAGLVCTTLVMSGTTMAALIQGQPSGLLSEGSGELVAAYMLASFVMKWLHPILVQLPQLPLKLLCFSIDGFATTFGTLSLGLIPTLKDPTKQSSAGEPLILPMILIPLLCGSGASLLVPFFGLFQPQFSFGHPGFLSENLSVDFWGPWMISLCYGTIVDGRGLLFGGCRQILQYGTLYGFDSSLKKGSSPTPWMKPDEAHVLCSLILSITYAINEFGPQILDRLTITRPGSSNKKDKPEHNGGDANAALVTGFQSSSGKVSNRKEKQ